MLSLVFYNLICKEIYRVLHCKLYHYTKVSFSFDVLFSLHFCLFFLERRTAGFCYAVYDLFYFVCHSCREIMCSKKVSVTYNTKYAYMTILTGRRKHFFESLEQIFHQCHAFSVQLPSDRVSIIIITFNLFCGQHCNSLPSSCVRPSSRYSAGEDLPGSLKK